MPDFVRILGQTGSAANTETTLYTVPSNRTAVVSSIVACNRGNSSTTFRISASQAGAATTNKDYLYYDLPLGANDTFVATMGVSLSGSDVLRVFSSTSNMSFGAFGVEIQ